MMHSGNYKKDRGAGCVLGRDLGYGGHQTVGGPEGVLRSLES